MIELIAAQSGNPIATGAADGGSGAGLAPVIIGTVVLVGIVASRIRGRALRPRRLLIVPLILLVLGAIPVALQLGTVALQGIDYLIAGLDLALSVGLGAARGFTVRIYSHEATTWYRYGPATVLLWCLSIVLRFALGITGSHHGATTLTTSATVILFLGLTLAVQNTIIRTRNRQPGPPRPQNTPA
jgi:hypothetical protein